MGAAYDDVYSQMPRNAATKTAPGRRRVTAAEAHRRYCFVEERLSEGAARSAIVAEAKASFRMTPRTVDDYIRKVRDAWAEQSREDRHERRAAVRACLIKLRRQLIQSKALNVLVGIERLLIDLDGIRHVSDEDFLTSEFRPMPPLSESLEEAIDTSITCIDTTLMMVDRMLHRQKKQLRKTCEQALHDIEHGGALARLPRREAV